jgi:hypothetical protein
MRRWPSSSQTLVSAFVRRYMKTHALKETVSLIAQAVLFENI